MLALDSLVIDLIFSANAELEPTEVLEALGGEDIAKDRQLLDPDMQDPRWELELSPSMPFRRRGERRLMIIDASVAPLREDPQQDTVAHVDLRPEKERLISMCEALDVRAGRLFGLGTWSSAVLCAKTARDLRALCLISWALDPSIDMEGRRRATPLGRPEFEEKLMAYDKRLEELDEKQILANIGPSKLERRGDFLVIDVLDGKGHWDLIHSLEMEAAIASVERFSVLPGAPHGDREPAPSKEPRKEPSKEPSKEPRKEPRKEPSEAPETKAPAANTVATTGENAAPIAAPSAPLGVGELAGRVLLLFPRERFDLDVAAAMGKSDWEAVVRQADPIGGRERDNLFANGGDFVAPLEFLSEVFVEGTPLSRNVFEELATKHGDGTRTLDVHCPRFGQVVLIDLANHGRFISSAVRAVGELQTAIRNHYAQP